MQDVGRQKNIAIVGTPDSWHVRDLLRASRNLGLTVDVLPFDALRVSVEDRTSQTPLDQYDAVVVRGMPRGTLEQMIFRMDVLGEYARRGGTVVNSPRALEIAIDKYLALSRMQQSGLPVPQTCVCQTAAAAIEDYHALGGDVVVKPLFGSEGRGMQRVRCDGTAVQVIGDLVAETGVVYLQRFVEHPGYDYRLFVVGERVWAIRRSNPDDWRQNVKLGAVATPVEVTGELLGIAHRAMQAVGTTVAGVDVLPAKSGGFYVLEVNAVPGWKSLSEVAGKDIAEQVLRHVLEMALNKSASHKATQRFHNSVASNG